MKQFLIMSCLVFATGAASADTVCNINRSSNGDSTFDQILYSSKVVSPQMIILRDSKAETIDFSQLQTISQWQAIDGLTFISLAPLEREQYAITVGRIDLAKSENATPSETIAVGNVLNEKPLSLTLPSRGLSVGCFNLP